MTNSPTIIASWFRALAESLENKGVDSKGLFAKAGLDIQETFDIYARYPEEKTKKLWELSVAATDDPFFGFSIADYMHPASIQSIGMTIVSSTTLLEGLQRLTRVFHVVRDGVDPIISIKGDSVLMIFRKQPEVRMLVAEESTDAFFAICAAREKSGVLPKGIIKKFYYARDVSDEKLKAKYESLLGAQAIFGAEEDAIEFDKTLASQPSTFANPDLAEASEKQALEYLQKIQQSNIVLQTREAIFNAMENGEPKQGDIAEKLKLSPSQLQRRLQSHSTTFSELVQDIRRELAKRYLSDPKLELIAISNLLGFGDQSNFIKAFKRWEGVTPLQYRKQFK